MLVNKIAYLGPRGTFSEEAALRFAGVLSAPVQLSPCTTIESCVEAVEQNQARYAVLPLENSLEGSVNVTLDLLIASTGLSIYAEFVQDIEHCLLSVGKTIETVERVYSHPQALAQCRVFLRSKLANAKIFPTVSTADAAVLAVKEGIGTAAIGSRHAADRLQLNVLASGIHDEGNQTRFIIVGRVDEEDKFGLPQKTSVLFAVKDGPGSLYAVLQAFNAHGVNLTRIESRPAKQRLGDYLFFADLVGAADDSTVNASLLAAAKAAVSLRVLGTYPVF